MGERNETAGRVLIPVLLILTSPVACGPFDSGSTTSRASLSPEEDRTTAILRAALAAMSERAPRDTVHLSSRWDSGESLGDSRIDALLSGDFAAPVVRRDGAGLERGFGGAVLVFSEPEVDGAAASMRAEYHTVFGWDRTHNHGFQLELENGERGWRTAAVEPRFVGDGYLTAPDDSSRKSAALRAALLHAVDSIPGGDRHVHTFLAPTDSATSGQKMAARILGAELISRRDAAPCPSSGTCSMSVPGPVVGLGPVDFTGPGRARATIGWRTDADLDAPGYEYDELDVWLEESADGSWRVVRSRIDPRK